MQKNRLEAFSDGVIAILITIMVLELRAPHGTDWNALRPLLPTFLAYVLSFMYIAIYWNNHHHMLQATHHINGKILWANQHLLFWLSLVPLVTTWMSENTFAPLPVAIYGFILLGAAVAYYVLELTIIAEQEPGSALAKAVGKDRKGRLSIALYVMAIALAFLNPWMSVAIFILVAVLWLVPDTRIESVLTHSL
ncbi:MAG: hypothetical protein JWM56_692 [Candidatus Peribacteria bacterium]|nr:hypothetical protein [Candidatus Peribacteria bacterium]